MGPIQIEWNGPLTKQTATETPDETMTAGEFAAAFAESHGIEGDVEFVFADGEPVPDGASIELLGGERIMVRTVGDTQVTHASADVEAEAEGDAPKPKRARKPKAEAEGDK